MDFVGILSLARYFLPGFVELLHLYLSSVPNFLCL